MFDATLKDREQSFDSAPGTTMFLHWLVGMVYVFYFASFILLLREVTWVFLTGENQKPYSMEFFLYTVLWMCFWTGFAAWCIVVPKELERPRL